MKEYYLNRLHWIFNYTGTKWWYCIVKTLCLIVGVPIYAVSFAMEMVLTAINMIFSWIPILNVVVTVICKALITVFGATFYICILPDIKQYKQATKDEVTCEAVDDMGLPEPEQADESADTPQDSHDDSTGE
ncbi:MAG: hypothetical protein J1G02_04180 [Clostridiales bacterium]|nr:hypothetical protein [Clostridiales bacterium]